MKQILKIVFCSTVCIIAFCYANAQSGNMSVAVNLAENNFKAKYFDRALVGYSAYKDSLNNKQQYNYAVSLLLSLYPSLQKQNEGIIILKSLINTGNNDAGMFLANVYFTGIGVEKDEQKAINIIEKLASKQYPEALYKIGTFYSEGGFAGYTENKLKAAEYYKKAAAKDYFPAFASLGLIAEDRLKFSEAYFWYKKALLYNDLQGMTLLANMYKLGKGIDKPNYDEATRIYYLILTSSDYKHSKYYSAYESFYSLGNKIPVVNLTIFKPLFLQLIQEAGSNFTKITGEEKQPIIWEKKDNFPLIDETNFYYKSNLDLGLKNAAIIKKVLPNTSSTRPDTTYSYQADISFYGTPDKSKEVFSKWATLINQLLPSAKPNIVKEASSNTLWSYPVLLSDGKKVNINLEIIGQKSDRVRIKITQ